MGLRTNPITMRTSVVSCLLCLIPAMLPAQMTQDPGPAIGQPTPAFTVPDQHGRAQTFNSLKGPNGLVLVFHRSADW
jgi:hypothetical protein